MEKIDRKKDLHEEQGQLATTFVRRRRSSYGSGKTVTVLDLEQVIPYQSKELREK
jgi:hypothetical protein